MLVNRVRKNRRRLAPWARREGVTCYRLYDRDIPEIALAVDWYEGRLHVADYSPAAGDAAGEGAAEARLAAFAEAVGEALSVSPEARFCKRRVRARGGTQYPERGPGGERIEVREGGLAFLVRLAGHADTGLFLDHRRTRARIRAAARGKRVLNLFAYTGAFTVYAAAGGAAETVSVDLSNTYLDWARDNLRLNGFGDDRHRLVRDDVLGFLEGAARRGEGGFDLVILDPPTVSRSKKMTRTLDIQRDHADLVGGALSLCRRGGVVCFSTNFQGFKLRLPPALRERAREITHRTAPADFRGRPHRCFEIRAGA